MEYGAAQARGIITLNSLKIQQYSLNMQMLLAIQNNNAQVQSKLKEQLEAIECQIEHMKTGCSRLG